MRMGAALAGDGNDAKAVGLVRRALDLLYLAAGYAAGVFLVLIFAIMMVMSVGRQFSLNIPAGDDFAAWCMAAMAFLGLAHTFKRGEMIRVGLLLERLHGRTKQVAEIAALTIATGFILYYTRHAVQMTYDCWRFNDMAQGVVAVPLWIPQLGSPAASSILPIAMIDEMVNVHARQPADLRAGASRTRRPKNSSSASRKAEAVDAWRSRSARTVDHPARLPGRRAGQRRLDRGGARPRRPGRDGADADRADRRGAGHHDWSASASWTLAALPLFIWMGEILFRTRLSEQMFRGLSPWLQWLPGRLMHVNIVGCGIFAAVSGSSAATCATIGKIALPELKKRGYDQGISLGTLAGSGTLGLLIPPSIPMVVYAVTANVSVLQVFLGGFLPGVLVMALYFGYIIIWSLLNPKQDAAARSADVVSAEAAQSAKLVPCLLLILAVFFSLMLGFATATECAAWGVTGALVLAWWSGTLNAQDLLRKRDERDAPDLHDHADPGRRGLHHRGDGLYRHPGGAGRMGQGPAPVARMLVLALSIMYIILGCLIDGISMIVLTAVIVLPMVKEAGFDLVWFGVYLVIHVEMAQITPPVGFNLFVLQNMSGSDTLTMAQAAFPFFLLLMFAVFIITEFPQIVLLLPKLAFPRLTRQAYEKERRTTMTVAISCRRAYRRRRAVAARRPRRRPNGTCRPPIRPTIRTAKISSPSPRMSRPRRRQAADHRSSRTPRCSRRPRSSARCRPARRRWARC